MIVITYLAIGFVSVFGWNTGQIVWDKDVEPNKHEKVEKEK